MPMSKWVIALLGSLMLAMMSLAYADQISTEVDTSLQKLKIDKDVYVCPMAGHKQEFSKPGTCPICGMRLEKKHPRLHIAVLVFNGVEEIDYAGPIEAFGDVGAEIFTVASNSEPVRSAFDVQVKPDYDIEHAPAADIIVVPGGGIDNAFDDARLMDWLRQRSANARIVMSVCNGAFILGKAGLLDGLSATTTAGATKSLAAMFPTVHAINNRRYVDNGKIITTAGLTSGIDGALHVIDREYDHLRAEEVARTLEYDWHPDGESNFGARAISRA
jgi:transcriptional regulator GlxA family with amidase domain